MINLQQMGEGQRMQGQIDDQWKEERPKMTLDNEDYIQQQRNNAGQKIELLTSPMANPDDECHLAIAPVIVNVAIVVN